MQKPTCEAALTHDAAVILLFRRLAEALFPNHKQQNSLQAAHPVPSVKMFDVKEIQQHLRDVFILIDDNLTRWGTEDF